jgi:hypothetical protein
MAYTTINKGSSYFNTILYTGDDSASRSITGVGFQPDWIWVKSRSGAFAHGLWDVVRTNKSALYSNLTDAEDTTTGGTLVSFNSDGFTTPNVSSGFINKNAGNYVAWNWLANGAGVSNTSGSITSTVSANTTSGFSIVSFTTTSGGNATIGHGLGSVPKMIIMKARTTTYNWDIYHVSTGNANRLLFTTAASAATPCWGSTTPTSSVFTMDQSFYGSGIPTIAYCFAEVKGFSKFGSYTGNGSSDGPFVYLGFRPAMIWTKQSNTTGPWNVLDNARGPYNVNQPYLQQNSSNAEATADYVDFLSNGFKIRYNGASPNASGDTIVYIAFAENPFVLTDGTPVTAR